MQMTLTPFINFMRLHYKWCLATGALLVLMCLAFIPSFLSNSRGRNANEEIIPVLAQKVERKDVNVDLTAIGTVQPTNSVLIKTQVDGRLIELNFRDGQDVSKGDVLAHIDPTLYQAQYDQAVAKKQQDEALLANAEHDLERYLNLAKTEYAPKQQADTQKALVSQLQAQISADQAQIDSARTYLDYTTIRAPISGRTGIRSVDIGNLLKAADATGIVTINQIQPIAVTFSLPQQKLVKLKTAMEHNQLQLEALDSENLTLINKGTIEVIDNQIDQSTGTIKLKANFPNEHLTLWPGQFVNLRLTIETLTHVLTLPTIAVQRGANGPFVYSVDDHNNAHVRPITLGYQTELLSVVTKGVDEGETIITSGFNRLNDEAKVRIDAPATIDNGINTPQRRRNGERGR